MSLPREQTDQANYQKAFNVLDVRQPGMGGLNTIVDQHDIKDIESPDMLNMWFDQGVIGNRPGSSLYAAKPTGETGTPLQLAIAKTSDGVSYLLSIYTSGTTTNNFYVWDTTNSRWIQINGSYAPTFTKITYFGTQSWNVKYGDDRLYLCNGYDDMIRWEISLDYLASQAGSSDTTLTLKNASRFFVYSAAITAIGASNVLTISSSPNQTFPYTNTWETGQMVYYVGSGIPELTTGTVYYAIKSPYTTGGTNGVASNSLGLATTLANACATPPVPITISSGDTPSNATIYKATPITVYDGTTATQLIYYNVSSNTLSLTGTVGTTIISGASVCPSITDRPVMPKGKILTTWKSRFIVTAGYHAENTMNVSRISEPEDYLINQDDITAGTLQTFNDGAGGIIDVKNFGEFLIIAKSNSLQEFSFSINQDASAQITQITPIIAGIGMGPISLRSDIQSMNSLYYPSSSAGFIALSPLTTGTNSSTGLQVISYNINNIIPNYDFIQSKGAFYKNKLFWTATSKTTENVIFMYDTVRQVWTKFDSWNPADMAVDNSNRFLFLSSNDGNVYQGFSGVYTDYNNSYLSYYKTKLSQLGNAFLVKTLDAIYVEGYMTQATVLYAEVLYNERGNLFTTTYKLANGVQGFQFTGIQVGGLDSYGLDQVINDCLPPDQLQSFGYFRGYLSVPLAYGIYALQVKFYTKDPNSVWFLTGWSTKPIYEESLPPTLRIDSLFPVSYFGSLTPGIITTPNGQTFMVENLIGTIDGMNTTFTVLHAPKVVVLNGSVLFQGDGWTITGLTITMLITPASGSTLKALY